MAAASALIEPTGQPHPAGSSVQTAGNATQSTVISVQPAALARLTVEDRHLLERILSESLEYIDHPSFCTRGAERKLYGAPAAFVDDAAARFASPPRLMTDGYLDGCAPTLTGAQEQLLFKRMNFARKQVFLLLQKRQNERLGYSTVRALLAWMRRALEARGEIVRLNMPLVLAMAKRTRLASVDYNDLVSEGNMALLRSVEKFDWSRGFKFSTYACRAILKSFSRVAMRMARYRCRFAVEYDPLLEKSDFIERKRERMEDECVVELRNILASNVAELSDIEQTVIRERFALWAVDPEEAIPKTLEQVGEIIGVTKERVRQIQNKALQKIKTALEEVVLVA